MVGEAKDPTFRRLYRPSPAAGKGGGNGWDTYGGLAVAPLQHLMGAVPWGSMGMERGYDASTVKVTFIYKKGLAAEVANYKPIFVNSMLYPAFMKIVY